MKHTMLINAVHKEQMRMATVDEKGKLIEFNIQMSVKEPITGNIYKGKVLKVERGLQAAFVDYGGGKDGFLPLRDVSPEHLTDPENGQTGGRPGPKARSGNHRSGCKRSKRQQRRAFNRPYFSSRQIPGFASQQARWRNLPQNRKRR